MVTLVKGVNCNVTYEEAVEYFETRLDAAAWDDLTDADTRSKALVTATLTLDQLNWEGCASDDTQKLAFPRIISYFDPRLGRAVSMNGTPDRISMATFELAYHLLNNDGLLDSTGEVNDLQLGNITLKSVSNPSLIPSHVRRIIRPLLINGGSRAVWRAW
jgi:hypothetical protein